MKTLLLTIIAGLLLVSGASPETSAEQEHFRVVSIQSEGLYTDTTSSDYSLSCDFQVEIENQTNKKITQFSIEPRPHLTWETPSGDYFFWAEGEGYGPLSWMPNTTMTFTVKIMGNRPYGHDKKSFKRTPTKATLVLDIKARSITIDDEVTYKERKSHSFLNEWKKHQKALGFR